MVAVILGMLVCVGLAIAVVGLVAVPARREGREVLTPAGEKAISRVRDRTGTAGDSAREKGGDSLGGARTRAEDARSRHAG